MCLWASMGLFPFGSRPRSSGGRTRSGHAMDAPFYGENGSIHYEFRWDGSALQPKTSVNGTSGFAKVISRSSGSGGLAPGYLGRVHLCAWTPCRAVLRTSKYGTLGPPLHVQASEWRPHAVPAEVAGPAAAVAALAPAETPPTSAPPPAPPGPASEATEPAAEAPEPAGAPPPAAPPSPPSDTGLPEPAPLPDEPARETFPPRSAAEPLPPLGMAALSQQHPRPSAAVAAQPPEKDSAQGVPSAQGSESRALGQLLALARNIRQPRLYIGYSALVCFALSRRCRPCVWGRGTESRLNTRLRPLGR